MPHGGLEFGRYKHRSRGMNRDRKQLVGRPKPLRLLFFHTQSLGIEPTAGLEPKLVNDAGSDVS